MSADKIITAAGAALAALEQPWDQARYDSEIRAARQQMMRGAVDIAEGNIRLAALLLRLRATMEYRHWGFDTLESYLNQVHGISKKTAYGYLGALEALGPDLMRQLIRDVGMQRTLWMAMIRDQSQQKFEELLEPDADGRPAAASVALRELEQINARLTAELEASCKRYSDKVDELAAAAQTHESAHARLKQIDVHNRELAVARDRAVREQEQAHKQQARERELRIAAQREAERKVGTLERQIRELSDRLRTPLTPSAAPTPIQVIGGNDPRLLVSLAQLCAQGVRGTNAKVLHAAPERARELGAAVGELIGAGVPVVLMEALRSCAVAVRAALTGEGLTAAEVLALRTTLNDFAQIVGPALKASEE